ncbi:unnamed protein product [Protopolystoma xenopodis]|uniref:Uncharacterized protein n=1 Tax=Protopolystoma xenopodis TaxID=117903 RepID=A0A3S5A2D3_9PLAT|nr:unnamed protein product [Protopolystoma xenopodis]
MIAENSARFHPKRKRRSRGLRQPERRIKAKLLQYNEIQPSSFAFPADTNLQAYLLAQRYIEELQKFLEEDNYKASLRLEPPPPPQPPPGPLPQSKLSVLSPSSTHFGHKLSSASVTYAVGLSTVNQLSTNEQYPGMPSSSRLPGLGISPCHNSFQLEAGHTASGVSVSSPSFSSPSLFAWDLLSQPVSPCPGKAVTLNSKPPSCYSPAASASPSVNAPPESPLKSTCTSLYADSFAASGSQPVLLEPWPEASIPHLSTPKGRCQSHPEESETLDGYPQIRPLLPCTLTSLPGLLESPDKANTPLEVLSSQV